jgi:uncharacterized OB-fold protein
MTISRPTPTDHSPVFAPYFEALNAGVLRAQQCASCATKHWPPLEMCGVCHSDRIDWIDVPSHGIVYTFTVSYRAFHPAFADLVPYAVVTVDVGDGIYMFGEYGGDDVEALAIGDHLTATFFPIDDGFSLVRWVPASPTLLEPDHG